MEPRYWQDDSLFAVYCTKADVVYPNDLSDVGKAKRLYNLITADFIAELLTIDAYCYFLEKIWVVLIRDSNLAKDDLTRICWLAADFPFEMRRNPRNAAALLEKVLEIQFSNRGEPQPHP